VAAHGINCAFDTTLLLLAQDFLALARRQLLRESEAIEGLARRVRIAKVETLAKLATLPGLLVIDDHDTSRHEALVREF